jgi:hypothetical protein
MEEWRGKGEIEDGGSGKGREKIWGEMNGREGMECLQRYVPTS